MFSRRSTMPLFLVLFGFTEQFKSKESGRWSLTTSTTSWNPTLIAPSSNSNHLPRSHERLDPIHPAARR